MKAKDITIIAVLAAILEIAKIAFSFIPNVELVSILVIVFTQTFKKNGFIAIIIFVLTEGLVYGFGYWWISYLYSWPLLGYVALKLEKANPLTIALVSCLFGLSFGLLSTLPLAFVSNTQSIIAYWISGIPWDLTHGISNFITALLLYKPLINGLETAKSITTY